jgi:hypothetical protein
MAISRIRAAISYEAPVASVTISESGTVGTGSVPFAAIQWINIVYSVTVDYLGLNPVLSEITVVVDTAALSLQKPLEEFQSAVDELQSFDVNKRLDESLPITEIVVYDYRKALADSVDATDDLFGEANIDDDQVMFLAKALQPDHIAVTENLEEINFGKGLTDEVPTTDVIGPFNVEKALEDTPSATEQHGFHLERSVSDTADAGDELNAQFITDDGQVSLVVKDIPTHNQFATDEINSVGFGKDLDETAQTSEEQDFDVGKLLTDSALTSEETVYQFSKARDDTASATEDAALLNEKPLTDSFTQSDDEVILFGKGVSDAPTAADELQPFVLGKGIEDTATTSGDPEYAMSKLLSDTASAAEQHLIVTSKPLSDQFNAQQEGPNIIEDYAAVGYFAEQYVGNGGPKRDIGKGVAEAAQTTDDVSVATAFARTFTDAVDATDDFDGEATAEDDQTAAVIKSRSDIAHATESLSFSGSFVRSDSIGASDVLSHLTGKTLQDSWTVSDAQTVSAGKGLTDTASTSESQTFNITKALADTANVTDDFDGAASIEDDQVMQFVTSRSEIATASESASLLAGKGLADSASTGDSGSLRMQGYCDDSYFAETYLGTSITF